MITNTERKLWTAWLSVPGIGRETFAKILECSARKKLSLLELWRKPRVTNLSQRQLDALTSFQRKYSVEAYWQLLKQRKIEVLTIRDQSYPEKLKQIYDPPWLLFSKGKSFFDTTLAGIVGTRRNTLYGKQVTEKIVRELVGSQVTIVSGFMYGIDTIAHQQAVASGGRTIAVLGYGFDQVTPFSHQKLYHHWLTKPDQVNFITEYPPSTKPKPGLFPLRNRIVAGLSDVVVVTEAAEKSGSLITAQIAIDTGRSVCAVPGSIFSRYSQGTRELINQGACLVSSGYQVLEELGYRISRGTDTITTSFDDVVTQKITQELAACAQSLEDLVRALQVPMDALMIKLAELEIEGVIKRQGNLFELDMATNGYSIHTLRDE